MTFRAVQNQSDQENLPSQIEGVTVVVPAYNEEHGIGPVLEDLCATMAASGLQHEVLVVDDGSTDRTVEVVRQHDVKLVQHRKSTGYGFRNRRSC